MLSQKLALAAAGNAATATYVDDVFSIDVWDGDGASSRTITNGIDLAGEGGMVWGKTRSTAVNHVLADTENGVEKNLFPNDTDALVDRGTGNGTVAQFNSNGFTIGNANNFINYSGHTACSWTFRKCPGFFDVVTFTSNNSSSGVTVPHSLGSTPGSIWVKSTSDEPTHWWVWHRSAPVDSSPPSGVPSGSLTTGKLDVNDSWGYSSNIINTVTSTSFKYGTSLAGYNNDTNTTFVAYIFAHDDQSFGDGGDEAIIKCGSYTGDGTTNGTNTVNLGFEPQWILTKRSDAVDNWHVCDVMRGQTTEGVTQRLRVNTNAAESSNSGAVPTSTGFKLYSDNSSGGTFLYIAIRRSHKPPAAGTDVFDIRSHTSDVSGVLTSTTITADMAISLAPDSSSASNTLTTRLLEKYLRTEGTDAANSGTHWAYDEQTGIRHTDWFGAQNILDYTFKRAPGFFDVVAYTGDGVQGRNITHNLGSVPEIMIVKRTDSARFWAVYHSSLGGTKYLRLNENFAESTSNQIWSNTAPTSSVFTVHDDATVNISGGIYVAYLFATVAGISKVGGYSGSGTTHNIDCGFTNGARFVLIKRTDSAADWYLFDTTQGINSGNDPFLLLNSTAAQNSADNWVGPLSSGFQLVTGDHVVNGVGASYVFLAIA